MAKELVVRFSKLGEGQMELIVYVCISDPECVHG